MFYWYKLQPATREPFLKPPKGKKLKTKPSPNTNSRSIKFYYPPPIIHDCQCANRMRSARVCCPNSAGNSLHFLSRPQAPISRLARSRQVTQTPFTLHLPSLSIYARLFCPGNAPIELPAEEAKITCKLHNFILRLSYISQVLSLVILKN